MIFGYTDYRDYLRSVLVERISRNPSYSLRALAQTIELSPSKLSEILKGKRNLSTDRASVIAPKLGLQNRELEYFCLLVQMESAKDPYIKESMQKRVEDLNPGHKVINLNVDLFRSIGDWYHTAILYLAELDDFNFSPREISKRLGISSFEADVAIERLLRLELLKKDNKGKYKRAHDFLSEAKVPNESLRKFHKQTLEMAIESLHTQSPDEKIIRTEQFAIDPKLLPAADELMEEFISKLTKLFKRGKEKTEVYNLGVQFFNFAKKRKNL